MRVVAPLIPANEEERLAELLRYGVLDTEAEAAFDRITRIASTVFETPILVFLGFSGPKPERTADDEPDGRAVIEGPAIRRPETEGAHARHIGHADQIAVPDFEMRDPEQGPTHVAGPPINSIGVWPAAALAARVPR